MGSGQSIPDMLDEEMVKQLAGEYYDSSDFESLSAQTPGYITKDQLILAAKKCVSDFF